MGRQTSSLTLTPCNRPIAMCNRLPVGNGDGADDCEGDVAVGNAGDSIAGDNARHHPLLPVKGSRARRRLTTRRGRMVGVWPLRHG